MLKEENKSFEVRCSQLPVDAVERMSDCMGNLRSREILLQLINIVSDGDNFLVLGLGYSPRQNVNLARILRKISCNLLANECLRQINDLEAALNRIVIGNGDVIHPEL